MPVHVHIHDDRTVLIILYGFVIQDEIREAVVKIDKIFTNKSGGTVVVSEHTSTVMRCSILDVIRIFRLLSGLEIKFQMLKAISIGWVTFKVLVKAHNTEGGNIWDLELVRDIDLVYVLTTIINLICHKVLQECEFV